MLRETIRFPRHITLKTNGTLLGRMPDWLVGGKRTPEWISINKLWRFLETVSRRQKSNFTTASGFSVLCFGFWPPGFLCFSFLPTLMAPLCSRALVIRRKYLLACERSSPDLCPGWGQGLPKEMWEWGPSLSFVSQRCRKAAPLNGQLQALENGPVLAEILLPLTLFPGSAAGCSCVPASVVCL